MNKILSSGSLKIISRLDGVRTLAITLVLICHYFTYQLSPIFKGPIKYLKEATFFTWSGVDLFFVLSGFLIGRILIFNRSSENYFKAFYMRRCFRIFPAYYFVLFVFILFVLAGKSPNFSYLMNKPFPLYSYFFYLQNFWAAHLNDMGAEWLGITWSLALEEQFYLVLPLIIYFLNTKYLPIFLITCIVLSPIIRAFTPGLGSYVLLPARMDSLLCGVLIAYYHLNGTIDKVFFGRKSILKLLITCFFILIFVCGKFEDMGGTLMHSVLTLFYGSFLIFVLIANEDSSFIKFLSNSSMAFIARISYMIYLTHQLFSGLLHQLLLNQSPAIYNYKSAAVTLLALVCTIGFSTISFYLLEKPILGLGKKYNY